MSAEEGGRRRDTRRDDMEPLNTPFSRGTMSSLANVAGAYEWPCVAISGEVRHGTSEGMRSDTVLRHDPRRDDVSCTRGFLGHVAANEFTEAEADVAIGTMASTAVTESRARACEAGP